MTTPPSPDPGAAEPDDVAVAEAAAEAPAVTDLTDRLLAVLDHHVLGQRHACEQLVVAFMAGGHALLEGVPGIGKTLLARAFAAALGRDFHRVQFTPDLMPADVVGTNVFEQDSGTFRLVRGPVFTEILMADEINRTPPKTQAALLEAMQEAQVTIDGERHGLDPAFFVVATQNPIELEGTYPLPEAQLDRFLLRISMGLPEPEQEVALYRQAVSGEEFGHHALPEPVLSAEETRQLRRSSAAVRVSEPLLDYLHRLAQTLRRSPHLDLAVSPRGALALLETARAFALLEGRDYLIPDDLKRGLEPCWGHRLILNAEAELEGQRVHRLLRDLAEAVEVPK
ncbi:MAG: MoxR family ATPase [Holophagales bacterium]|nr:MoxR family ATPase [Holophagales bacterium]